MATSEHIIEHTSLSTLRSEHSHLTFENVSFGFFVYLMTDLVLFASLFAVYAVLHNNIAAGPSGHQIFNYPLVLTETLLLLTSSFTCGLTILSLNKRHKKQVYINLAITFLLGLGFLTIELSEFRHLVMIGDSWRRSGFLSSFFVLVGTHGLHILIGLSWMVFLAYRMFKTGFSRANIRRFTIFSLFWHFLDIIWIFIFTIVYLMGAVKL